MKINTKLFLTTALLAAFAAGSAFAQEKGTKDEAVAMVKKAVDFIKSSGTEKAYAEFSSGSGQFKDRDLYVVVYDAKGKCLAHGSNAKLVGKDLSDSQDADGKYYVKERMELVKAKDSFWQGYKFSDPLTKKISPKETYCEKLSDTAVCVGIYK